MKLGPLSIAVGALSACAACGGDGERRAASSLAVDLSRATQHRVFQPLDTLSAQERAANAAAVGAMSRATVGATARETHTNGVPPSVGDHADQPKKKVP
jgi:hypothetical protein